MVRVHHLLSAESSKVAVACGVSSKEVVDGGKGCVLISVLLGEGILVHLGDASASAHFCIATPDKVACLIAEDAMK